MLFPLLSRSAFLFPAGTQIADIGANPRDVWATISYETIPPGFYSGGRPGDS